MFKSKLALAVALGLGMSSPLWAADGGIEARLAALEAQVLDRVLALPASPPQAQALSPLPTQLRWAL